MLKVFEAFSGYGSQSISLEKCGIPYEVVGISETDVDAVIAYAAIRYNLESYKVDKTIEEMREELISKNVGFDFKKNKSKIPRMKKSKLELLYKADKLSKNLGDISLVEPIFLPDFDYFTYSFPCQDISVAGLGKGIKKGETRSGLLYECEKIIETNKPKYLLMENVKNLVGKKFKSDFDEWCEYLESLGYKNFYKVLNAKDFGIAQNRERVFMVSILNENACFKYPEGRELNKRLKDFLEDDVDEKYYLSDYVHKYFKQTKEDNGLNDIVGSTKPPTAHRIGERDIVYGNNAKKIGALTATDYKQPKQILVTNTLNKLENNCKNSKDLTKNYKMSHNEKEIKIRKLTPRECFRLMGLDDLIINKIQLTGLSNSAQYKLAGNSIVINVLNEIHKELFKNNNY